MIDNRSWCFVVAASAAWCGWRSALFTISRRANSGWLDSMSLTAGRRTRLVRARIDHHRAGAGEFRVLRQRQGIRTDSCRRILDATGASLKLTSVSETVAFVS